MGETNTLILRRIKVGVGSVWVCGATMMEVFQRVLVSGRVQQVGYRDFVVREARRLGVTGWVRNLSDGRVEFLAGGDQAAVDALLVVCREGPRQARVDDLMASPIEGRAVKGFTKRFTA